MKLIVPRNGKIILSYDGCVRIGKHVIGYWDKDYVAGTSHFRPSTNEGKSYYTAKLNNGDFLDGWTQAELREAIIESCKDGIKPAE